MKVLVTGNMGFIGTVMTGMLEQAGHQVAGLDSDFYRECDFLNTRGPGSQIPKDIRDVEPSDLDGFDAIIHLAALSNDPLGNLDTELTFDINYRATIRLAEIARDNGVKRFLFSSSCSNYGASGEGMLTEEAQLHPVTPYGISKVRAEAELSKLATDGFSPVMLRSATAYGVSPRLRADIVLNNLTLWAVATGKILLKSDGTPWRPIVHVSDICRAFSAVLSAPRERIHNQAFNVGRSQENFQVRQIAQFVKETVPGCELSFTADAGPDVRCYRVSCAKILESVPDFKPCWTARAGARELYEALRDRELSVEDFEGPRFKRIAQIKKLLAEGRLNNDLRWKRP